MICSTFAEIYDSGYVTLRTLLVLCPTNPESIAGCVIDSRFGLSTFANSGLLTFAGRAGGRTGVLSAWDLATLSLSFQRMFQTLTFLLTLPYDWILPSTFGVEINCQLLQDALVDALGYGFAEIVESLVDFGADLHVLHVDQVPVFG